MYIGLGSNIGNKVEHIEKAIEKIESDKACSVQGISSFYETKAFGHIEQDDFINAVIKITTNYSPEELYNFLKNIEIGIGRTETIRWGPRKIDLDILFFNDLIYHSKNLQIPHKGITERDFVLLPLCEIEPGFIHPELNRKISDIYSLVKIKTVKNKLPFETSAN